MMSPSSRRAWIEINIPGSHRLVPLVALLAEGVDRNSSTPLPRRPIFTVALLAEGVDRNFVKHGLLADVCQVALLAEGVDRNVHVDIRTTERYRSPSSRRAWIEISFLLFTCSSFLVVALLAEGVDRNLI